MTHSDLMTLAMPLFAVAAVALTGAAVVYQATHRTVKARKPRALPDSMEAAIGSGHFPVVLLSKRELEAYAAFVKDHPHAAE